MALSGTLARLPCFSRLFSTWQCVGKQRSILHPNVSSSVSCHRYLFTKKALNIVGYELTREEISNAFYNTKEKFMDQMKEDLESKNSRIREADLRNVIHLAKSEDDVSIAVGMLKRYCKQAQALHFHDFVYGPVVMRMFHHLDMPDRMMLALTSEELKGLFDQLSSHYIAMDLLYKHERYQEVVDIFEDAEHIIFKGEKYPRTCLLVAFAALYKMNTQESYEKMYSIWESLMDRCSIVDVRSVCFASALALNQGNPRVSHEILLRSESPVPLVFWNLRVLSLLDMNELEEAVSILQSLLQWDSPNNTKGHYFFEETVNKLEDALQNVSDKELVAKADLSIKAIENFGLIHEKTLDEILCLPVEISRKTQSEVLLASSFFQNRIPFKQQNSRIPFKQQNSRGDKWQGIMYEE